MHRLVKLYACTQYVQMFIRTCFFFSFLFFPPPAARPPTCPGQQSSLFLFLYENVLPPCAVAPSRPPARLAWLALLVCMYVGLQHHSTPRHTTPHRVTATLPCWCELHTSVHAQMAQTGLQRGSNHCAGKSSQCVHSPLLDCSSLAKSSTCPILDAATFGPSFVTARSTLPAENSNLLVQVCKFKCSKCSS